MTERESRSGDPGADSAAGEFDAASAPADVRTDDAPAEAGPGGAGGESAAERGSRSRFPWLTEWPWWPGGRFATGELGGEFPYARAGSGGQPLVVLPGFGDAMFPGYYPPAAAWAVGAYFARFLDDHTVYLVSRPRGLPAGHAIENMADDHAAVFDAEIGPADVLGFSMGGMIGQALASRYPDLVDRLVLANSGAYLARSELGTIRRFLQYAEAGDWAAIRAALAEAMFSDLRGVAYPLLARTVGSVAQPRPADPGDVSVSLRAIAAFDATTRLPEIDAATLVFGGEADPFFPPPVLEGTAEGIPDAERVVIEGAKHAAFHEFKGRFDRTVDAFLDRS